jgi:hypothetical protein
MEEDLKWKRTSNDKDLQYLKIVKVEYLSNHCMYHDLEDNSEEI